VIVLVIFVGGCIGIVAATANHVAHVATQKHTITYVVTGSPSTVAGDITYDTIQEGQGQNGEAQLTEQALPWSKTITASGLFTSYTVSVTNASTIGLSYVQCTLKVDGRVVNTNRANGPLATAACHGSS